MPAVAVLERLAGGQHLVDPPGELARGPRLAPLDLGHVGPVAAQGGAQLGLRQPAVEPPPQELGGELGLRGARVRHALGDAGGGPLGPRCLAPLSLGHRRGERVG